MRMTVLGLTTLAVCAALGAAGGCKKQSSSGDIKIGHVAALSGDNATFGVSADEGIRLALDEINGKGGVLGKQIKLTTEDDRSMSDEAKTVASKLITRDGVVALLGEIASSRSISMAPVAEDSKVPMLSPGSTNPKLTIKQDGTVRPYVFRACFTDEFQGKAIALFALRDLKMKRFAVLCPTNSDFGTGFRDYIKKALAAGGGEVVAEEGYTEKQDREFKPQLANIQRAKPEAIFVTGYYTEAGLIAKQARELGITVPLLGGDGWDSDQTVKIGESAINGCYFTNHYSPDEARPEVKAFVTAYMAKYKDVNGQPKTPDAMAILGYDSMKLMADAIARAGVADGEKIRDALAATKDFPGASGSITIDANHNANKPIVVIKIDKGQFKYVATVRPES